MDQLVKALLVGTGGLIIGQQIYAPLRKFIRSHKLINWSIELTSADWSDTNLTSIDQVIQHIYLEHLYVQHNSLYSINSVRFCGRLRVLDVSNNNLRSLNGLQGCTQLQVLNCSSNPLYYLTGIEECTALTNLNCSRCRLTRLNEIINCTQLTNLDCSNNSITDPLPIISLPNLTSIRYGYNPFWFDTHDHLARIAERPRGQPMGRATDGALRVGEMEQLIPGRNEYRYQTQSKPMPAICANNQNVHDSSIQKSVYISVKSLLRDPVPTFSLDYIIPPLLDSEVCGLLSTYCRDKTIQVKCGIDYQTLLAYVWQRIEQSPHKNELLKILSEQIIESKQTCFVGRFVRTLSVLAGFCPDINVDISDSSRIGSIIISAKDKIIPYSPKEHRATSQKLLTDIGYTLAELKPWLDAIYEEPEEEPNTVD